MNDSQDSLKRTAARARARGSVDATSMTHPMRSEPVRDGMRTRKRKGGNVDKFHIPPEIIPEGTTYEWKRLTTMGMEDPGYYVGLREQGWLPVKAENHPEFMPPDWSKGTIERDGMILMERPSYLTEEARQEDIQAARDAVRMKEAQLGATPHGQMDRVAPALKRQRFSEPIEVPADSAE